MSVFYTGNVWQRKGDVVSLSGDGIGAGLARLALFRFPDARGGAPQYFPPVTSAIFSRDTGFIAIARGRARPVLWRAPFRLPKGRQRRFFKSPRIL